MSFHRLSSLFHRVLSSSCMTLVVGSPLGLKYPMSSGAFVKSGDFAELVLLVSTLQHCYREQA